jgi:HTH-type transcriptional regulator / antitoxin HipB
MRDQIARTPAQIGEAIRRRRKALLLTQKELGHKAKLRQATVSGLEGGEPGTQLSTLLDILAMLELELVIRPRSKASPGDIAAVF